MKMKRKTKIVLLSVFLAVMLIASLIGGGKYYLNQRAEQQHEEMVEIVKDNQNVIWDFLKEYDQHDKTKSMTIEYQKVEHNPMGGIEVSGYINHNKRLQFSLGLSKDSGGIIYVDGGQTPFDN